MSNKTIKQQVAESIHRINGRIPTTIGCHDCKAQWEHYCQLCKKKGTHRDTPYLRSKLRELGLIDPKIEYPNNSPKTKKAVGVNIEQPLPITWENFHIKTIGTYQEYSYIPNDFKLFFESKTSQYYVNDTKDKIIRVSDHWGLGIANCDWFLYGYTYVHCGKFQKLHGKEERIGIISIKDFEVNKR